jgi:hypothetical protein
MLGLTSNFLSFLFSIDDDILNLMDEVDLDEFVKEASDAIEDSEKLSQFVREKATICIERFLVRRIIVTFSCSPQRSP